MWFALTENSNLDILILEREFFGARASASINLSSTVMKVDLSVMAIASSLEIGSPDKRLKQK